MPISQVFYLAPKILRIIASIVINHNEKFGVKLLQNLLSGIYFL